MSCNINPHILRYMEMIENGEIRACKEQHQLCALIRKIFETEDIYTDAEQIDNYLRIIKYYPFDKLFEWEEFLLTLHLTTYRTSDGMPRFPDLFMLIGRGAGKDGYLSLESACLTSPYNPIKNYDVDICGNNEDQATRPVNDFLDVLEAPANIKKLKRFWYWNKEMIRGLKYGGIIKGRTNSPKGKDGLRSGAVLFNEVHEYRDYKNIKVFTTGLGKKKHPRRTYATTNGDVREGPLDDYLDAALDILSGDIPDDGMLPFICRLDSKDEIHDPENWQKANPSLPYLPNLRHEIEKEYVEYVKHPRRMPDFMTKRMNIPDENAIVAVTSWDNIASTNTDIPDLYGHECVVGVDFSKINDWCGVNHHFKIGDARIDINHAWMCLKSKDIDYIKAPWREWADMGLLTLVDDIEIPPRMIAEYIAEMAQKYTTKCVAVDNFRISILSRELEKIGVSAKNNMLYLTRPSDIMKVSPIIDSVFENQNFVWGNNPMLRWATNNTCLIEASKNVKADTGNTTYGKIERHGRKTDPFMALVASMTIEDKLTEQVVDNGSSYDVVTW